jgi:hypothetical protein
MAPQTPEKRFGQTIRALREAKKLGLRRFAEMVGMSPTYLSKVERDEFAPPAEAKVIAIAHALGENPDELLALAGRVASDLPGIIRKHPREMASFLRAANGLSAAEIERLAKEAEKRKRSGKSEG